MPHKFTSYKRLKNQICQFSNQNVFIKSGMSKKNM